MILSLLWPFAAFCIKFRQFVIVMIYIMEIRRMKTTFYLILSDRWRASVLNFFRMTTSQMFEKEMMMDRSRQTTKIPHRATLIDAFRKAYKIQTSGKRFQRIRCASQASLTEPLQPLPGKSTSRGRCLMKRDTATRTFIPNEWKPTPL